MYSDSWIRRQNIVKMWFLSMLIYRCSTIPNKFQTFCFVDIGKLILKFIQEDKRSRIANTILNKNKVKEN